MFDARPNSLVFRAWAHDRQLRGVRSQLFDDLFRSPDKRRDGVDGGHRPHPFGVGLFALAPAIPEAWLSRLGCLSRQLPQIGFEHRDAFAVAAQD